MLRLDLDLLPTAPEADTLDAVIVVDVLRMTTTAAVLFDAGLARLEVVASVEGARRAARGGALLLGERGGVPPEGFDGGNSPRAYRAPLGAERAVLCTSNGSAAVERMGRAPALLLGAIVNARAVAAAGLARAERELRVVCAGTAGRVSLDDALGAACILRAARDLAPAAAPSDACRLALDALDAALARGTLLDALRDCRHGRTLERLGFGADLDVAADLDRLAVVPERVATDGEGSAFEAARG